ncbi:hypothetical protein K2X33_10540 [bacterium]|nr:hypothetical protein [bacterium]
MSGIFLVFFVQGSASAATPFERAEALFNVKTTVPAVPATFPQEITVEITCAEKTSGGLDTDDLRIGEKRYNDPVLGFTASFRTLLGPSYLYSKLPTGEFGYEYSLSLDGDKIGYRDLARVATIDPEKWLIVAYMSDYQGWHADKYCWGKLP